MTKQEAVREALAQALAELRAMGWPFPRAKVIVHGYSRESGRRALPDGSARYAHITRHLPGTTD